MLDSRLRSSVSSDPTSQNLRAALETLEGYRLWFREDPIGLGRAWFASSLDEERGARAEFRRAVETIAAVKGPEEAKRAVSRVTSGEDRSCGAAAEAAVKVASSRLGHRKKVGLLLIALGVSYREAARLVNLQDHAALYRRAAQFGLRAIHRRRQQQTRSAPDLTPTGT